MKKNKQIKRIELVFLLWFITLPFGSIIGGISIGFMTLYPSLVIGVVLFILVIPSIKEWKRSIQLFFLLLLVWLIYASSWFLWNSTYEGWKIDIKSLFLQFIYAGILFGSYYILGIKQFKVIFIKGLTFFLSIIIIIGILEYSTGVHLLGTYTDKLLTHEVVTDVFYAPIFIYDNPNNYLVYFIGLTTLYFSLVVKKLKSPWKILTVLSLGFIFSSAAESRIIMVICVGLILIQLYRLFKEVGGISKKTNYETILLGAIIVFTIIMFKPLFVGPKYSESSKTTTKEIVSFPQNQVIKTSSGNVRVNLFKNGIDLIKENPILGVGPGQYRWNHKNNNVVHSTEKLVGPHNYVIELISQYGIISWVYLIFIVHAFILNFKKVNRSKKNLWSLLLFPVFGLMSLVPSSFLYLDINWLIVPMLLLFSYESLNSEESINESSDCKDETLNYNKPSFSKKV